MPNPRKPFFACTVKEKILALRGSGQSYGYIAQTLSVPKSVVAYHCSEKTRILAVQRRRKRRSLEKEKVVAYKGGKCKLCTYNRCMAALEFHHTDPSTKDSKINLALGSNGMSFESAKAELDKCVLLCSNCHREVHVGLAVVTLE